ncbi:MAG: preprotein translocase subunit YajC [Candidatus Krumholzibacteriia bacterium]
MIPTPATILAMSPPPEGGGGMGALVSFLPLILIMLVFWFMIIRPQKRQQEQRRAMLESLKKGDRVVTSGGLFATILNVKEDRLVATIADGIKVEIAKAAVTGVVEKGKD